MTSNKRKLSELSNEEKSDALVQLEKRLNVEFDRTYGGEEATELQKAWRDAVAAWATLENCKKIAEKPFKSTLNTEEIQRIYAEFDEIYGTGAPISMAFRDRNPRFFGSYDHRSDAKKKADEKFKDRDAAEVKRLEQRQEALMHMNDRMYKRVVAFNTAVMGLYSNQFTRPVSGGCVQTIDYRPHT